MYFYSKVLGFYGAGTHYSPELQPITIDNLAEAPAAEGEAHTEL